MQIGCIESASNTARRQPPTASLRLAQLLQPNGINRTTANLSKPTQYGKPKRRKGARDVRAYPYCKVMPAPHRFSQCLMKASNQTKQAEERVKNDIQVARLSIASGRVEDITDGDEH
ncbi:hypothetical protein SARC_03628 [Sphaeroforma arctica JP610]|uniref:Uncharacterized protein n=1 Tax=Sphaeroforma arctica JP610 TaxID=667725 RepID=A0A0L0G5P9_9EUKA|nr:hypothetical protein SARC_03628 [Sphaeroforma arctica JP610]KNC84146.1 hypothetical protein SARC_03628 [Sphaeroforma arctica JP610]|eukprot:XP_014158048.1 hypothetical protein SARC_03628 [Sphaeroforma arctica JP610]